MKRAKDKTLAAILSFFGGMIGLHRFYLGQKGLGILMIILTFFTMGLLTALISLIDAIAFFTMDQEVFDLKYNSSEEQSNQRRYGSRRSHRTYGKTKERPDYERKSSRYRQSREESRHQSSRYKSNTRKNRRPNRKISKKQKKEKYKELITRMRKYKTRGIELFRDYDFEGAIKNFRKVLEIDPSNVAAHFNIACAYSQTEQSRKAMFHISEAVKNGFNDFEKIKKHEKLAFARIQPEWEVFSANNFVIEEKEAEEIVKEEVPQDTKIGDEEEELVKKETNQQGKGRGLEGEELFSSLKKLKEQRENGIISDSQFEIERRKLMS